MVLETRVVPTSGEPILLIDCVDRRYSICRPAAEWVQDFLGATPYVMTRPGPVRFLQERAEDGELAEELEFYLERGINIVVIHAHQDCIGNPESDEVQGEQLRTAVVRLLEFGFEFRVLGLFSQKKPGNLWLTEPVYDTEGEFAPAP